MTIISLKPENSSVDGIINVEFSDGSSAKVTVQYLPEGYSDLSAWQTGKELNPAEEEIFRFAASCCKAEKAALKLIARAEQNSLGLSVKLEQRGYGRSVVNAVVSGLQDKNFIDDRRYAKLWIRTRIAMGNAKSPKWLRASLGKRGIDKNSALQAIKEVLDPETEYSLLLKIIEKSRAQERKAVIPFRAKLKYEGFSSDVIDRYFDMQP